eukprot:Em0002g884a
MMVSIQAICSLRYTTVEDVASVAAQLGPHTLMAKIDIESAYCLIPVHPEDRFLLGVNWRDQVYIDPMLSFGLHSASKNFNVVADALEWCLRADGIRHVFHYLDDFMVLGAPGSDECSRALEKLRSRCTELGIPLADHKCEGPSTKITFLGIVIDTSVGELSLPAEKLNHLRDLLEDWGDRHSPRALVPEKDDRSPASYPQQVPSSALTVIFGPICSGGGTLRQLPIVVKELLPILLAAIVWVRLWHAQKVLCYCDNQALQLWRYYSPGPVPTASKAPAQIQPLTVELLLDLLGDWISPAWMRQFKAIFTAA